MELFDTNMEPGLALTPLHRLVRRDEI